MKKLALMAIAAITAFGIAASAQLTPDRKLRMVQGLIDTYYVDTVNSDKIAEEAIIAMLGALDPHSVYSDAEETKALTEPLQGNFSGIGIQFNMLQDTLYVIQTIAGGPSEQVGVRAGDRIIAANDTAISGVKMSNADIIKRLRGPKGSVVNIDVARRGQPAPLHFRIVRDDIPLYSVDAAYMAAPATGYIRISRFAADTPKEFAQAFNKLRKQGMRDLIIDLEDNGGGYLGAAVEMANNFLRHNDVIVYTKGRNTPDQYFRAEGNGKMLDGRVVVMVNEYSASASEILSGALQDNDRGVVVGRRTFGKGLVQRPFPFPDGSMIRLTVSRYYTPAGRSIQKPYEAGDGDDYSMDLKRRFDNGELTSADSIHFADSLRYETLRNHRTVYGGGGIMPDRFVPIDTMSVTPYYRELRAKNAFNQYAIDYVEANRDSLKALYPTEQAFIDGFSFTPEMMDGFTATAEKLGVTADTAQPEKVTEAISTILTGLIARDLFESGTYYRVVNKLNPVYREALRIIGSPYEYDRLLSNGK
ncbi:MAG: S41 family peptidase [Muribaculaceae bacterium]|nr:S41 family peptidase [Muribaculaceae bacterium]